MSCIVQGPGGHSLPAVAAHVPRDAAVGVRKVLELRGVHRVVHAEAVREHDGRALALFDVVDLEAASVERGPS